MKNIVRVLSASMLILLSGPVVAEETPIYESLSDVSIGRVFFSASQRAHLDRLRGTNGVSSNSAAKTGPTARKPANPDAAGFIVSKSGKARIYRNGDFVEVSSEPDVKFPDDVAVTRKPDVDTGAADDEAG